VTDEETFWILERIGRGCNRTLFSVNPIARRGLSLVPLVSASGRIGRKGRMLPSAFVQVDATYDLGTCRQAAGGVTPQDERNAWIDR
jgi:hypothetical protein